MFEQPFYIIGDKQYTRDELLFFGRQHYPKFYWIKRGIGIGALASAAFALILIFVIGEITLNEIGREYANLFYGAPRMVAAYVGIGLDAATGVVLIASSFTKPTDEQCFIHGEKCLRQIAQDRAYFRSGREEKDI